MQILALRKLKTCILIRVLKKAMSSVTTVAEFGLAHMGQKGSFSANPFVSCGQ